MWAVFLTFCQYVCKYVLPDVGGVHADLLEGGVNEPGGQMLGPYQQPLHSDTAQHRLHQSQLSSTLSSSRGLSTVYNFFPGTKVSYSFISNRLQLGAMAKKFTIENP